MNVERLRAQPDLVSTKNIAQIKEEFNYIPQAEQVAHFYFTVCFFMSTFFKNNLTLFIVIRI